MTVAVTSASSATGMSDVPAHTTRTLPLPRILRSRRMEMAPESAWNSTLGIERAQQLVKRPVAARHQNVVLVAQHARHDAFHLLRGLAPRKHHFRKSLPQRAVMIDFGVTQIFIGKRAQALHGVFHGELASPDLLEHAGDFFWTQGVFLLSNYTSPPGDSGNGTVGRRGGFTPLWSVAPTLRAARAGLMPGATATHAGLAAQHFPRFLDFPEGAY